jgi:hypothetical protein
MSPVYPSTYRISAGTGVAWINPNDGVVWEADDYYSGRLVDNKASCVTVQEISNTFLDTLYCSNRYFGNPSTYNFPIANGNYSETLMFADTYVTSTGQRLFDFKIQEQSVATSLAVFKESGGQYLAYSLSKILNPLISAIEIVVSIRPLTFLYTIRYLQY